ncbi:DNA (cytosine-5)-methyltransferase 1 [Roseovarius tolerans]|uniref:Cytosine-specific methyltransferase n=1 Tax=Roseovarius tolerans TaxID=74031 RepID=A0A1H8JGH4_9RHOB|nr:DNA cytosine methyltransferase [Roseovarius tolerans]SEN79904.1 DNA (cytosine-5)-methyltransferase 1 [Roseovarius tolerans]
MLQQITEETNQRANITEPVKASADRYTMVDLFAGCGGLSLGFEDAGFTPVFVNELNHDAMATYLQNRHHELGGMAFADNEALRCNDAQSLKGKRLEALISDLANIPEANFYPSKTSKPEAGDGSTLDVLAGGPPCQGYSGIGIRRSYAVDRKEIPSNHLFGRMAQIIRRVRPRIFLFENVRGLLNAKWTREEGELIFPQVKAEFRKIPGYEVRWSLVFAKNYGVPQNRPRVLLVGIRKDIIEACSTLDPNADPEDAIACGFLPKGQIGKFPDLADLLGDLVDPPVTDTLRSGDFSQGAFETKSYPKAARTTIQKHLRRPAPWNPDGRTRLTEQEYSKHKREVVEKFDYMLANDGEIPERFKTRKFSQRVLKERWGNGEPNMTATSLPDDYVHYSQPRILTVREWARLQLFPDWYQFAGKRTTGGLRRAGNPQAGLFDREVPKYTQIGNAVPVGLAEKVGEHFKGLLDEALGGR